MSVGVLATMGLAAPNFELPLFWHLPQDLGGLGIMHLPILASPFGGRGVELLCLLLGRGFEFINSRGQGHISKEE